MQIKNLHLHLAVNRDEPYRTYFRNSDGSRCWIFRGLGILFVAVLKAVR